MSLSRLWYWILLVFVHRMSGLHTVTQVTSAQASTALILKSSQLEIFFLFLSLEMYVVFLSVFSC